MSETRTPTTDTTEQEVRHIRNKDVPVLESIFSVMREIESLQDRMEWQKARMYSTTRRMSQTPGGGGGVHKGFDDIMALLDELNGQQEEQIRQYVQRLRHAEKILNSISNVQMRAFVRRYYVDSLPKKEIMDEMELTEYAFNKIRSRIEEAEDMKHVKWPVRRDD